MSKFINVLSSDDIDYIKSMPEVVDFISKFNESNPNKSHKSMIKITLNDSVIDSIKGTFGINVTSVPITLIRGDTLPHIDKGAKEFEYTYIIYVDGCDGKLIIGDKSYAMDDNTGFMFLEGVKHETTNTNNGVRLLIGPMDEFGNPVGVPPQGIYYYNSLEAVMNDDPPIGVAFYTYTLEENVELDGDPVTFVNGIRWKIYDIQGESDVFGEFEDLSFVRGDEIAYNGPGGHYYIFLVYPFSYDAGDICFVAGTPITTDQGIIDIDKIDPLVNTIGNKKIVGISKTISNEKYLVTFCKDALGVNCPIKKTTVSETHKVLCNGQMVKAIDLVNPNNDKIKKKKYRGQFLYNILMEKHSVVNVNGMICETLDPENEIAKNMLK